MNQTNDVLIAMCCVCLALIVSIAYYPVAAEEDYVLDYENVRHEELINQCVEYANEEPEICNEPIKPEFRIENMLVTIFYYDTLQAFQEDTGETDPEVRGHSLCETKPDKNIAYCDFYVVMPKFVDDDFTMTFGHEALHGLLGDYHKNAP